MPSAPSLKKLIPVRLPPGRARLATRPSLTGSSPTTKTIGIVVVAALAANAEAGPAGRGDHGDLPANQFGRQRRQPIGLILGPAVFDRHVLALDIAGVLQALAKCAQSDPQNSGDLALRNPITGIAGCCARAASGHAAAAPPSSVMNSRRSHSITSSAGRAVSGGTSRPSASRRLEVDDELEFGRLQHRQVGGLRAFEDAAGIDADLAKRVRDIGPVAHQPAGRDMVSGSQKLPEFCRAPSRWQTARRG